MSSLPSLRFIESVTTTGESSTIIINSILIYLTVFYIKNIKGGYKMLVLALPNLEIVFALLEYLIQPSLHSYNSSFSFFTINPVYGASKSLKLMLLWIYSGLYALLICLIAVQFFYRYCLIIGAKSRVIKLIDTWWWVYCTFWAGFWLIAYWKSVTDRESMDYLREVMVKEYDADIDETAGFSVMIYVPCQNTTSLQSKNLKNQSLITIFGLSFVLSFQYLVIFFCGYHIHMKLKLAVLQMSPNAHGMQRQLFKTLIFQILNPCIFHHIPAFIIVIIPFLDLKINIPTGYIFCFYSVFPSIDSLAMMYLVTEYQMVVRNRLTVHLEGLLNWIRKFTVEDGEDGTTAVEMKEGE